MLKSKKKNKDAAENPDSPSKTALSKDHDHDQPINPETSTSGKTNFQLIIMISKKSIQFVLEFPINFENDVLILNSTSILEVVYQKEFQELKRSYVNDS